jgi:hypothetical protein
VRRPALLAAVVGAVVLWRRRAAAARAERDLWAEAGVAPDLR